MHVASDPGRVEAGRRVRGTFKLEERLALQERRPSRDKARAPTTTATARAQQEREGARERMRVFACERTRARGGPTCSKTQHGFQVRFLRFVSRRLCGNGSVTVVRTAQRTSLPQSEVCARVYACEMMCDGVERCMPDLQEDGCSGIEGGPFVLFIGGSPAGQAPVW